MILLIVILLSAVAEDLKSFHISNRLILSGAFCSLLYGICSQCQQQSGFRAVFLYAAGRIFGAVALLFLLLPLWRIRVFGGGDVKLLCVCELTLGLGGSINTVLYALFCGAGTAIVFWVLQWFFPKILRNRKTENGMHRIHFSIPILLGVCLHIVLPDLILFPF